MLTYSLPNFHSEPISLLLKKKKGKISFGGSTWFGFYLSCCLGVWASAVKAETVLVFLPGVPGPWWAAGRGGRGASWGERGTLAPSPAGKGQGTGQQGPSRRREGSLDSGNPNGVPRARRSRGQRPKAGRAGSGEPRCPRSWLLPATPLQDLLHLPEHRLHKHPQRLDVDPGNKGFAEVHLEPAQQGALRGQESRDPSGLRHPMPLQERTRV